MLSPSEARSVNIFPRDAPRPARAGAGAATARKGARRGEGAQCQYPKHDLIFRSVYPRDDIARSLSLPLCFVPPPPPPPWSARSAGARGTLTPQPRRATYYNDLIHFTIASALSFTLSICRISCAPLFRTSPEHRRVDRRELHL